MEDNGILTQKEMLKQLNQEKKSIRIQFKENKKKKLENFKIERKTTIQKIRKEQGKVPKEVKDEFKQKEQVIKEELKEMEQEMKQQVADINQEIKEIRQQKPSKGEMEQEKVDTQNWKEIKEQEKVDTQNWKEIKEQEKLIKKERIQKRKEALNEIDSYKDKNYLKFRQIIPRYGITKTERSDNKYFDKIIKIIKKEIKTDSLRIEDIIPRIHELLKEKYGEPMSQEDAMNNLNEERKKPLIENEKKLEQKFGIQFQGRLWFKCTIEEMKHTTFTNTNARNIDYAYVFIEDTYLEIVKESYWLKSKMGNRKVFYDNIASIDYDARGRLSLSNSLEIHLKSSDNIQLKFIPENMVNLVTTKFDEYMVNKNSDNNTNNTIVVNNTSNNADELLKYAELYEKGLLTKEEFEFKKAQLLGMGNDIPNSEYSKQISESDYSESVSDLVSNCPNCGKEVGPNSHFCSNCGFNLG